MDLSADNIKPRMNQVLLHIEEDPEHQRIKASGLELPDDIRGNNLGVGVVLRVGPGMWDDKGHFLPTEVKPGERVALLQHHMKVHKIGRTDLALVAEADLWGVVG
jgi:co-chaperonin GroES (HSP10)